MIDTETVEGSVLCPEMLNTPSFNYKCRSILYTWEEMESLLASVWGMFHVSLVAFVVYNGLSAMAEPYKVGSFFSLLSRKKAI